MTGQRQAFSHTHTQAIAAAVATVVYGWARSSSLSVCIIVQLISFRA
jgi:hypothetical protein